MASTVNAPASSFMRSAGQLPAVLGAETSALWANLRRSWRVLWTLTLIECRRKYAGSILGTLWYPLYSGLLLGSYVSVAVTRGWARAYRPLALSRRDPG